MLETFTNIVLLFLLCISWPYSLQLIRLITERVYLHDKLAVMSLVYCRALTAFMTSFSSAGNVLTLMGIP